MHPDHEGTPRFNSHLVVCNRLRCCLLLSFLTRVCKRREKREKERKKERKGKGREKERAVVAGVLYHWSVRLEKRLLRAVRCSGEHEGKERWTTWSSKMSAYCASMAPRLGELMGTSSTQDVETRQDALTPSDAAHSTNLYYILSLLTDAEALNIVQNSLVSNGLEVWRRMVTRWDPKVPSRFPGVLQATLVPQWDIPGSDVAQLLTAWEKQIQDYEQQSGDKISDAIKLGVVLHHLPDASLRAHLLLNSRRVYDTWAWQLKYEQWPWQG